MKRKIRRMSLSAVIIAALVLSGCAAGAAPQAAAPAEETAPAAAVQEAAPEAEAQAPVPEETAEETVETALPPFTYPVDDPLYAAINNYVVEELGSYFDPEDVSIPCIRYVSGIDTGDPEDIRVLADFRIFNYDLEGDTLVTQSGGSFPGCMHLKQTGEDSYEVVSFDQIPDGEDFAENARKIAGDDYDAFMNILSNRAARRRSRITQPIINCPSQSTRISAGIRWNCPLRALRSPVPNSKA